MSFPSSTASSSAASSEKRTDETPKPRGRPRKYPPKAPSFRRPSPHAVHPKTPSMGRSLGIKKGKLPNTEKLSIHNSLSNESGPSSTATDKSVNIGPPDSSSDKKRKKRCLGDDVNTQHKTRKPSSENRQVSPKLKSTSPTNTVATVVPSACAQSECRRSARQRHPRFSLQHGHLPVMLLDEYFHAVQEGTFASIHSTTTPLPTQGTCFFSFLYFLDFSPLKTFFAG